MPFYELSFGHFSQSGWFGVKLLLLVFDQIVYVMPSSSARCSQLPRASDKVPFFVALRKLRDHVCGRLPRPLDESEVVFPDLDLKVEPRRDRRPQPVTPSTTETVDRKRQYPDDEDRSA